MGVIMSDSNSKVVIDSLSANIVDKNSKDKVENELNIGVALKKMLKDFRKEFYK